MTISAPQDSDRSVESWIPRDDTFGARLALVRHRMRWNIKEAASECSVPAASWRLWELEDAQPRRLVEIAGLIADRTGCDLGWLIAGTRLGNSRLRGGVTAQDVSRPAGYPRGKAHPNGSRRPALIAA